MSLTKNIRDNYWIRSGLLNLIQNTSNVLFGFGSFYLLLRVLDKNDYGTWILFLSSIAVFAIARNGLLQNATIKFISGTSSENEKKQVIATTFSMNMIMTIVSIALMCAVAPLLSNIWNTPKLTHMLWFFSISFVFSSLQMHFNSVEQAFLNFKGTFLTQFLYQSLFFTYVLVSYIFDLEVTLMRMIYANLVVNIIATIPSFVYIRKRVSFRIFVDMSWAKRVFHYGKYSMGTSINAILSDSIDQMMLGAMLSPAATGIFNIAVRISNLANVPTNAMATIVFPQGAKRLEEEGLPALKYLYEKSVGTILAVLIPALLCILLFADTLIHYIAGGRYDESLPLLKITLFYSMFVPFSRQLGTILDSMGKTKLNFLLVLTSGVINIGLNYVFITRWGIMGAAFATLLTYIIFFLISQYTLRNLLNVSLLNVWKYTLEFYPEMFKKIMGKKNNTA
ncbi:flippase [Parapedobacter lycopersici]|uniref:flippase n=1 Tax=Parapedobacter lycopersici TaxID=1864939 RepID=UPI00214DE6E9|nr:flippase [Parapedobacter lycopersici]